MAELFEVAELIKVAVEDERSGVAFYSRLAEKSATLRPVFAQLAEEEKYHLKRFQEMLDRFGGHSPREEYPGEYMEYLRTLTETRAFPDAATAMKMAGDCASDADALALAGRFERDTLILMNEMRRLVNAKDAAVVDELAAEEQGHLVTLAAARKQL